jgi:hypothetical protein
LNFTVIVCIALFCAVAYFLFSEGDEFFYFNFVSMEKEEAILQALPRVWVCTAYKYAYT